MRLLEEALNHFYDSTGEPLFSPLHNQIEAEQAPWMFDHESIMNDLDGCYADDDGSRKNSECETPKAMSFGKDGRSCNESDGEAAEVLGQTRATGGISYGPSCANPIYMQDVDFSSTVPFYNALNSDGEFRNHTNTSCNVESAVTGIRIRSRPSRSQPHNKNSMIQANVTGRIRLQCNLQARSVHYNDAIDEWSSGENEDDSKPVVKKARSLCLEVEVEEKGIIVGRGADRGTIDESQEIPLHKSSKATVLLSNTVVSVHEETSSQWMKFSARRSRKPLTVVFRVAVLLILFIDSERKAIPEHLASKIDQGNDKRLELISEAKVSAY
ncbi:hypothetical protein F3Y22_tig00008957pilonHSYRG00113 [Hibiscus syriacus]|uniref:Uncharacterized protein n=1 Tax=Hibiscus syriacus TaxID=106335 RepID=A0A6A3CDY6_HIBSY|nr:hypothetical protein F3Y22_tig00008957pilonHSYRG00113 [Hibiscus syriacus]